MRAAFSWVRIMYAICKDGAVKAIGTPGGEELALINALARRELGADEVYMYAHPFR